MRRRRGLTINLNSITITKQRQQSSFFFRIHVKKEHVGSEKEAKVFSLIKKGGREERKKRETRFEAGGFEWKEQKRERRRLEHINNLNQVRRRKRRSTSR